MWGFYLFYCLSGLFRLNLSVFVECYGLDRLKEVSQPGESSCEHVHVQVDRLKIVLKEQLPEDVHELSETRLKFGDYEVWSFKVEHSVSALGYVFKEKNKCGKFLTEKLAWYGLSKGPILGKLE